MMIIPDFGMCKYRVKFAGGLKELRADIPHCVIAWTRNRPPKPARNVLFIRFSQASDPEVTAVVVSGELRERELVKFELVNQ